MTALPWPPDHLLTLEEFAALPEDKTYRYELQEGVLIVSPRPVFVHQTVAQCLAMELNLQLPKSLGAVIDVEVVTNHKFPGSVRAPDVVVMPRELTKTVTPRLTGEPGNDATIVVEIISPGSHLTDTVTKPVEYANLGIPHYWVIDLEPPISLTAYHLAGEFGYQEAPAVTGTFTTSEPFPLAIDLPSLTDLDAYIERMMNR